MLSTLQKLEILADAAKYDASCASLGAVDRIIVTRRHHLLRLDDLARLAGSLRRARPFIITPDYRPIADPTSSRLRAALAPPPEQLTLFG